MKLPFFPRLANKKNRTNFSQHQVWVTKHIYYHLNLSESVFGFLANSADPDQPASCWLIRIYTVCHIAYVKLHGLVDMSASDVCSLAKILSDGNFYLLFGENY